MPLQGSQIPFPLGKSQVVIKALSKEIQSDPGFNFTSGIFLQVMHYALAGHLKYNGFSVSLTIPAGCLEKYHQALETMIKAYCFDNQKESSCRCLLLETLYRNLYDSVLLSYRLATLWWTIEGCRGSMATELQTCWIM